MVVVEVVMKMMIDIADISKFTVINTMVFINFHLIVPDKDVALVQDHLLVNIRQSIKRNCWR
jgi:hypothetical protein